MGGKEKREGSIAGGVATDIGAPSPQAVRGVGLDDGIDAAEAVVVGGHGAKNTTD